MGRENSGPFAARFVSDGSKTVLELVNTTEQSLKSIDILTVFLKDDETPTGPSRAHIKFETVKNLQPQEKAVMAHRTWIDGKPAAPDDDLLQRLTSVDGSAMPYVLDISWEGVDGKTRYQRMPVGH